MARPGDRAQAVRPRWPGQDRMSDEESVGQIEQFLQDTAPEGQGRGSTRAGREQQGQGSTGAGREVPRVGREQGRESTGKGLGQGRESAEAGRSSRRTGLPPGLSLASRDLPKGSLPAGRLGAR